MNAQELLQEISDYCRQAGLAESTFGRRAVNDGKLTARLRSGGRITTDTLERIRSFMALPFWACTLPLGPQRVTSRIPKSCASAPKQRRKPAAP